MAQFKQCLSTVCISSLFPILFVVPLYLVSKGQRRADINIIRKRLLVTALCVPALSFIPTYIEQRRICADSTAFWVLIGFGHTNALQIFYDILQGALPVLILFMGSILTIALEGQVQIIFRDTIESWIRDLVVSPIMEELCFRSGLVSYLHMRKWTYTQLIFVSPLFFSVSHVHHLYDNIYNRGMCVLNAVIVAVIQCTYTYAFGCFAAFLLVASGGFVAPCVAHVICNMFGFPRFGDITYYKNSKIIILGHICGILGFIGAVSYLKSHSAQYLLQATC